jgi:hypothetical protein
MILNYFLLLLAHALAWFTFSGLWSVLSHRSSILKWSSALAMGIASGVLHIIICLLKGVFL